MISGTLLKKGIRDEFPAPFACNPNNLHQKILSASEKALPDLTRTCNATMQKHWQLIRKRCINDVPRAMTNIRIC